MPSPNDPVNVRQGRLGKQVLVILVVSLVLAVVAGWILWGLFYSDKGTIGPEAYSVPAEVPSMSDSVQRPVLSASSGSSASD